MNGVAKLTIQFGLLQTPDIWGDLDHKGSQNVQKIDKKTPAGRKRRTLGGISATQAGLDIACFPI